MAMVGFRAEDEGKITECDSPFKFYEKLKESQIFRFLKLIGCNNEQVGEFAKFVKRRNKIAHPTGTVFFNDQQAIDDEIADMMREVRNIEEHMEPVIEELYIKFLKESAHAEELQYGTLDAELNTNFVHKAYMSAADLRHCAALDVATLAHLPNQDVVAGLHACVLNFIETGELKEAA